ncbi:uncharacterized protein ColSpa_09732 [Colletotrichum spaethianum]|uniref:Uncharacterized protein n=1 Tax=Colletotrichum spaethianum TaxID=700344 RepID=A0AA37PC45_9PEZI|nr:uncharacterized protein ColSpa_09732 [Colletotrichum spaethianum]GKT49551.1 hypothetical protein ColSpa_09732 [Colletotrichum spaethianum]
MILLVQLIDEVPQEKDHPSETLNMTPYLQPRHTIQNDEDDLSSCRNHEESKERAKGLHLLAPDAIHETQVDSRKVDFPWGQRLGNLGIETA